MRAPITATVTCLLCGDDMVIPINIGAGGRKADADGRGYVRTFVTVETDDIDEIVEEHVKVCTANPANA